MRSGRTGTGAVVIQEQRVFASRDVMKADARPGGYVATGGHGGVIGTAGGAAGAVLRYVPLMRHTYRSEVNISKLPVRTEKIAAPHAAARFIEVMVKNAQGKFIKSAIPKVSIIKDEAIRRTITTVILLRRSMSLRLSNTSSNQPLWPDLCWKACRPMAGRRQRRGRGP